MNRIEVINESLTGFVCGICGFVPIIGIGPALFALARWMRVRRAHKGEWNPAAFYLNLGALLGLLSVLEFLLAGLGGIAALYGGC